MPRASLTLVCGIGTGSSGSTDTSCDAFGGFIVTPLPEMGGHRDERPRLAQEPLARCGKASLHASSALLDSTLGDYRDLHGREPSERWMNSSATAESSATAAFEPPPEVAPSS